MEVIMKNEKNIELAWTTGPSMSMSRAVTDAMEAEAAARSTDSTDWHDDDVEVGRGTSEAEPDPKRHKAGQVTTDTGTGRATAGSTDTTATGVGGAARRYRTGASVLLTRGERRKLAKAKKRKATGGGTGEPSG